MAKPFPETVNLKKSKCPCCGKKLDYAMRQMESVVTIGCQGCSYNVELFWLGPGTVSAN